jgi:hypothetical protein
MFEREPVLCPYCHEEMEAGNIRTANGASVFYLPESVDAPPLFSVRKAITKRNGFFLEGPYFTAMHDVVISCYACRKCKKVIISYEEE